MKILFKEDIYNILISSIQNNIAYNIYASSKKRSYFEGYFILTDEVNSTKIKNKLYLIN